MSKLDELKEKLKTRKLAIPPANIPMDLTPLFTALDTHIKEALTTQSEEDIPKFKATIHDIIKAEFSEQSPEYQQLIERTEKTIAGLVFEVEMIRKSQSKGPIEIKRPSWFQEFSDSKILNAVGTLAKNMALILRAVSQIDLAEFKDPSNALAVKLVTKDGKVYTARGGRGGGGSGGTTQLEGYDTIVPFNSTVPTAGTKVQISASSIPCKKVVIQAGTGTGFICIGNQNVLASSSRGMMLASMQAWTFEVSDVNLLYIDSTVSGKAFNGFYVY